MKVGFTGTQKGTTTEQFAACTEFFLTHQVSEFHHGVCIGADEELHTLVIILKTKVFKYPSNIRGKVAICEGGTTVCEPQPPIKRNHMIVDAVEMLLACPETTQEVVRSGTWATIRYARKVGIPIWIVLPNGEIKKERSVNF